MDMEERTLDNGIWLMDIIEMGYLTLDPRDGIYA